MRAMGETLSTPLMNRWSVVEGRNTRIKHVPMRLAEILIDAVEHLNCVRHQACSQPMRMSSHRRLQTGSRACVDQDTVSYNLVKVPEQGTRHREPQ